MRKTNNLHLIEKIMLLNRYKVWCKDNKINYNRDINLISYLDIIGVLKVNRIKKIIYKEKK